MLESLVSVIVPVYNVEKYVSRCLNSVIHQSYRNIEIIVIDDGSTDKSGGIVDKIAKHENRITVIHQQNGGLSKARNVGIGVAKGKYITFIDSDDYVSSLYIEHMIDTLIKYKVELVQCDFKIVYDYNVTIDNKDYNVVQYTNKNVFYTRKTKITACGKLFNTELVKKHLFPENKINEDEFFTYKMLYESNSIALIDCKDYFYYQSNNSIMRNNSHFLYKDIWEAYEERILYFENNKEEYLAQISKKEYCIRLMLQFIKIYNDPKTENCIDDFWNEYRRVYKDICKNQRLNKKEMFILKIFYTFPNIIAKLIGVFKK